MRSTAATDSPTLSHRVASTDNWGSPRRRPSRTDSTPDTSTPRTWLSADERDGRQ